MRTLCDGGDHYITAFLSLSLLLILSVLPHYVYLSPLFLSPWWAIEFLRFWSWNKFNKEKSASHSKHSCLECHDSQRWKTFWSKAESSALNWCSILTSSFNFALPGFLLQVWVALMNWSPHTCVSEWVSGAPSGLHSPPLSLSLFLSFSPTLSGSTCNTMQVKGIFNICFLLTHSLPFLSPQFPWFSLFSAS